MAAPKNKRTEEDLKPYLQFYQMLSHGETLKLYIATSTMAVSVVLVREEDRKQLPINCVSRIGSSVTWRSDIRRKVSGML